MAPEPVVIGADVGTTSAKAVAFDATGAAHGAGQAAYPLREPRPGRAEQDPEEVVAATCAAIRDAAREAEAGGARVVAVSLSSAMHGLLGIGGDGAPLTPLLTWADRRAADQADRLRGGPRGPALHRRTGTPVHPMSPLLKLRWLSEREPELFARVPQWGSMKELLLLRLCGELAVDHGIASGTGLFNLGDGRWDDEALAYAGIDAGRLAEPVAPGTTFALRDGAAAELGVPAGTPIVAGGADGPLANLGVGAIGHGAVACSIGTSGAVRVVSDAPRVDDRGRTFCYVLAPGRWVIGGAVNNGGSVLDWCAQALAPELAAEARAAGRPVAEALLEAAAQAPPGAGGLLMLPYLLGERAPRWSSLPRGVVLGLRQEHRREHLLRAALEGVCLQLAVVLSSLGDAGVDVRSIRATGGFARSPLWRRILAGAFGRPVGFADSPEGSALGAAFIGLQAVDLLDDLGRAADIVALRAVERPDRDEAELYARLLPAFDEAYDALVGPFRALAALQDVLPDPPPAEEAA
jgi:gluconokinase